jgi:hypothetical protein
MAKNSNHKILVTRWNAKFTAYGVQYEARHDHPQFLRIKELLAAGQVRQAVGLVNNPDTGKKRTDKKLAQKGKKVLIEGNTLRVGAKSLPPGLTHLYEKNVGKTGGAALRDFLVRYSENNSAPAAEAFARFLEKNAVAITSRGTMLLYKRVRADYTDCHTGRFDNHPGKLVFVDRKAVDPDPNKECSYGLHVCGYQYLNGFSSPTNPTLVVEVDPRDVVSVPRDYNSSKIRVCRYKVWFEVTDFRRPTDGADVLGQMRYFDMKDLPDLVAKAKRRPNSDLTKDWT